MGEVRVTRRYGQRSLFWPMLLIGIGTTWLLVNIGVFKVANITVLARLWPLLLIVAGVDLLFGRRSRTLGGLIGIGTVVVLLLLMLIGPSIGLATSSAQLKTAHYEELVGDATTARVVLGSGVNAVHVQTQPASDNIFSADIAYYGDIRFDVSGTTAKTITLEQTNASLTSGFESFLVAVFGGSQGADTTEWNIGLNPGFPLSLRLDAGVGDSSLDLSGLQLTDLDVNSGVGTIAIVLPATSAVYNVQLNGGVGDMNITLPEGVAVQLTAKVGVGSLNLPPALNKVSGNTGVGEDGVWETQDFHTADFRITIQFDGGVGSLTIR